MVTTFVSQGQPSHYPHGQDLDKVSGRSAKKDPPDAVSHDLALSTYLTFIFVLSSGAVIVRGSVGGACISNYPLIFFCAITDTVNPILCNNDCDQGDLSTRE